MDLFQCVTTNQVQELELLLGSGTVNINERSHCGYTALHYAITCGREECVRVLLEHGADLNIYTPMPFLISAIHSGCVDIIKMLLEYGCDFNDIIDPNYNPLHLALQYSDLAVIERLLLSGVDPNTKNHWGESPLYTAINFNRSHDIIELLLNHGADPNHLPKDMEMSDSIKQFIEDYFVVPIKEPGSY